MSARLFTVLGVVLFLVFFPSVVSAEILINKFLPAPSTGNNEWVEFYNSGEITVDLSDYYFDDDTSFTSDSGNSARIALSGLLSKSSVCFWDLSTYLNNNGDSPTLFHIDGTTKDTYTYTKTTTDKSFSRIPDGGAWAEDQIATKASTNCSSLAPTQTPTPVPSETPVHTPTPTHTPVPSKTPTPMKTSTPTVNPKPSASVTVKLTPSPEEKNDIEWSGEVLGDDINTEEIPGSDSGTKKNMQPVIVGILLTSIGCSLLGVTLLLKKFFMSKHSGDTVE